MKYIVILADGMADEKIEKLGGKTPLEYAHTPYIDHLAPYSEIGCVNTLPKGCAKGSDTANLSVLGYDPEVYYFGRSPLEALSMKVPLKEEDVTFRTNLITVSEEETNYEERRILDHSCDEISTSEASVLIQAIEEKMGDSIRKFYSGISYRHLLVWQGGSTHVKLTPPHDILDQKIGHYKPQGDYAQDLWRMMEESYTILKDHPINKARKLRGLKPANSIWIWGEGTKPKLPSFKEKYGIEGAVISAVDLIKGIGIGAGMTSIDVEGATGNVYTNYKGKADAALKYLLEEGGEFIYIHLEGPDECGHRGEIENKALAISHIDTQIIGPIVEALKVAKEPFKLMILPDHPTPVRLRTHTDEPVPYMIYHSLHHREANKQQAYCEAYARTTGNYFENGYKLMGHFLQ